jgi:hypothetical protein
MPQLVIVTPALRDANNGNWQTARRWQRHAAGATRAHRQDLADDRWPAATAVMIALHARRSAESIAAWSARIRSAARVVLTGTDLYRDIAVDAVGPALAAHWRSTGRAAGSSARRRCRTAVRPSAA